MKKKSHGQFNLFVIPYYFSTSFHAEEVHES